MKRITVLFGILGLVAAAPCAAQGAGQSAGAAAVAKVRAAYQAAANAQDSAGIAKLYAPDGEEMPPNAPSQKGRAAIEAFHKALATHVMVHGLTLKPSDTRVVQDVAYEVGTYTQQTMPAAGGQMSNDTGKYVVLMKKDAAGAWWVTHAIYNSDMPIPAPPPAK